MASSSIERQHSSSCWLLLLALTALHMYTCREAAVEALPITSRPIDGNAQGEAWKAWLRLSNEQQTLEKPKKVMPKSIFALPFRHCPPGHKLYNELCIPQVNINPTDIVAEELQGQLGESGSNFGFTDYDYSESDELVFKLPLRPLKQNDQFSTIPSASGTENQDLPSEDVPLKFSIFEMKFPTAPQDSLQLDVVNATTAVLALTTTIATSTATAFATANVIATTKPTIATFREDTMKTQRHLDSAGNEDLQPHASNALSSKTSLSIPSGSNIGAFGDFGNIDAIVVPAGVFLDADPTVTSSMSDEPEAIADPEPNAAAALNTGVEAEAEAEADLAQLLKVDAFVPAIIMPDIMPPFSLLRISPLPIADDAAPDIVLTANDGDAAATSSASGATSTTATLSSTQARIPGAEQKKMKEQSVPMRFTVATAGTTVATTESTATAMEVTTASTATETKVAAIHQDANGNTRDNDRLYYQPFTRNVAASGISSSSSSSTADGDLDMLNDMASSDNLMTNTIGGQGDSERAASEINVQRESRIIIELVKGKRILSQLRKPQHEQQSTTNISCSSTTMPNTTATTIIANCSVALSSRETSSDTTATKATKCWSKLMIMLDGSSTEATAATKQIAETTASAITIAGMFTESTISTTASPIVGITKITNNLSISTNRRNRNSKIIRLDGRGETTQSISTTTVPTSQTPNDDSYTPFWWLPSIGWSVDRQIDEKGEDRSLLLRFFRAFRANDSDTTTTTTAALLSRL